MEQRSAAAKGGGALGVVFAIVALDLVGFGIVIPQLGIYAVEFHASPLEVGVLLSTYSALQLIGAPILGRLSDRYGRRPVLLVSLVGSVAGYLLFAVAHSLPLLFASRMIHGLSGANISTAQAYVSDVTSEEERAKGMGIVGAAFGIGFVLGPAIGGGLGSWGGNRAIGLGAAAMSAAALVAAWVWLPESRRPGAQRGAGPLPARRRIGTREIAGLLAVFLVFITAFSLMEGTFSMFLLARHVAHGETAAGALVANDPIAREASWRAGLLFTVVGLVSAAVQGGLIGALRSRFKEAGLARAGLAFTALALALIPVAPSYGWLFGPMALVALGSGLANPSLSTLVSLRAGQERQGEALGAYQATGSLGRIIGPALGGELFGAWGPSAPYLVAAAMMVACLGLALAATRPRV